MSDFPYLETERLLLRELTASDAHDVFAIHSDRQAMRWFGSDPLTSVQEAQKLIETFAGWRQLPNPGTRWGIQRKTDLRFLGTCGLFRWNRSWKSCVTGYELASFAQKQGFMFEALTTILGWGFENMGINRVEAQVHPDNLTSIKLLSNLGFVQEGCMREAGFWLGSHHDLQQFGLLRRDFVMR
jgi:ribosomal-protein-alanine N-acetyltransferase